MTQIRVLEAFLFQSIISVNLKQAMPHMLVWLLVYNCLAAEQIWREERKEYGFCLHQIFWEIFDV